MNSPEISPIELFRRLEQGSLGNQLAQEDIVLGETWRGFVFTLADLNIVVPFVGEYEIVPYQEISPLPLAKNWVKGMTNIRGEIYTVVDFSEFMGKSPIRRTKNCNLLLLPYTNLKSALLIEGSVRLQSFSTELTALDIDEAHSGMTPFLRAVLEDNNQSWYVIDIEKLTKSVQFTEIGL